MEISKKLHLVRLIHRATEKSTTVWQKAAAFLFVEKRPTMENTRCSYLNLRFRDSEESINEPNEFWHDEEKRA